MNCFSCGRPVIFTGNTLCLECSETLRYREYQNSKHFRATFAAELQDKISFCAPDGWPADTPIGSRIALSLKNITYTLRRDYESTLRGLEVGGRFQTEDEAIRGNIAFLNQSFKETDNDKVVLQLVIGAWMAAQSWKEILDRFGL